MTTTRPRRRASFAAVRSAVRRSPAGGRACVGARHRVDLVQQREHRFATGSRRDEERAVVAEHEGADAVARPAGEEADRSDHRERKVALLELRGAEVEAGRTVDHDPRLELAVGDGVADVRDHRARGDRPVHSPDVVTHLVLTALTRLGTGRGHEPEMIALEQTVETAEHVELEAPERGLDPRCRRGAVVHAERSSWAVSGPDPLLPVRPAGRVPGTRS